MLTVHLVIANVVWPALYVEERLFSLVPISVGIVVEFLVLRFGFQLSWKRGAIVDLVMNGFSSLLGLPLIPLAGLAWEVFPGLVIYKLFNIGSFSPVTWAGTFVLAVMVTTLIEAVVIRWLFAIQIPKRRLWMLAGANVASVASHTSVWLSFRRSTDSS